MFQYLKINANLSTHQELRGNCGPCMIVTEILHASHATTLAHSSHPWYLLWVCPYIAISFPNCNEIQARGQFARGHELHVAAIIDALTSANVMGAICGSSAIETGVQWPCQAGQSGWVWERANRLTTRVEDGWKTRWTTTWVRLGMQGQEHKNKGLTNTQTASCGSGSEHTNANKHTCKERQGPRSKLEIKVGSLSFITYHLSIDTRETCGWGKGLGGVAECQPWPWPWQYPSQNPQVGMTPDNP